MNDDVLKVLGGGAAILLGLYALKERASGGSGAFGSSGSSGTYSDAVVGGEENTVKGEGVFYPDSGIFLSSGTNGVDPVIVDDYYNSFLPPSDYAFAPTPKQDSGLDNVVSDYRGYEIVDISPLTDEDKTVVPYRLGYAPSEVSDDSGSSGSGSAVDFFEGAVNNVVDTGKALVSPVVEAVENNPYVLPVLPALFVTNPVAGVATVLANTDPVREFVDNIASGVSDSAGKVVDNVVETGKTVADNVVETGKNVVETGKTVVNNVVETGKTVVNNVVETGKTVVDNVVETGKNVVETGKKALEDTGKTINNWVNSWKWW